MCNVHCENVKEIDNVMKQSDVDKTRVQSLAVILTGVVAILTEMSIFSKNRIGICDSLAQYIE
jgi:hypothetical protein